MVKTDVTVQELTIQPLGPETWDAFAALAERHKGVWGGCWCTWFLRETHPSPNPNVPRTPEATWDFKHLQRVPEPLRARRVHVLAPKGTQHCVKAITVPAAG